MYEGVESGGLVGGVERRIMDGGINNAVLPVDAKEVQFALERSREVLLFPPISMVNSVESYWELKNCRKALRPETGLL